MKMLKYFIIAIIASLLVLSSCSDDDPDPIIPDGPVVTFEGVDGTSLAFDFSTTDNHILNFEFTVQVDAPGGIKTFNLIRRKLKGAEEVDEDIFSYTNEFFGDKSASKVLEGELDFFHFVNQNFDKVEFEFIVEDDNGKVGYKAYTVTDVTKFPVSKQGFFYHIQGPDRGAYGLEIDTTVAQAGEAALKNMINTDAVVTPTTPFTGKWKSTEPNGNGTLYFKANNYNFTNGLVREAIQMYKEVDAVTEVEEPAVGDIFIAKHGEKYYIIKITSINPSAIGPEGTSATVNKGKLEFDYKKY